jgi:hypothetical protein
MMVAGTVTGSWMKLPNEELHNLYSPLNIVGMIIKLRQMRWAAHVVCMGEMRNVYKILIEKPDGKRPLTRPRRIILKWILGKYGLRVWVGFI